MPTSSIVPKRDALEVEENKAEIRNARVTPKPESKSQDFGKLTFPSESRAAIQKTIEKTRPTTKSKPFEVSTGIWVKGKKKTGNSTVTKRSDKKEILSKIFDNILFIIKNVNKKLQRLLLILNIILQIVQF